MDIEVHRATPAKVQTGVLVVGAFADGPLPPASRAMEFLNRRAVAG